MSSPTRAARVRRMRSPIAAAAAVLLLAAPASGQDRTAEIDRIFSFATADTPGCAVGVSQRGTVVVNRAYGLADVGRRVPLGPRSVFDIGSTQKQFVAAAVLLLVEDGRLALSDDVRTLVPELPGYGTTVTIDHLLTHTSGVRDWTGLLPMAADGTEVLPLIVRQRALNFTPGTEWAYSNSGFVLLKEIVARASGMPFAEFARRRLFAPLGMTSSAYVADILQDTGNAGPRDAGVRDGAPRDRALAYHKADTGWTLSMRLGNARGGGAVVSTAGDLLRWNDALTSGRLGAFVTGKLQEQTTLRNGRRLSYARGLIVDTYRGGPLISHSGGAAGYSTWMGRLPAYGLSVVVLCNGDPVSATALARRAADVYLTAAGAPADQGRAAFNAPAAANVDVSGRAGLFFHERTGEPMRLVVDDGRLRIANGPPLVAVAQDRFRNPRGDLFFRSQDEFALRFLTPDLVEFRSMEGQTTQYRRAQPWTPTAADRTALDGRYASAELGSTFDIVPGTNGLVMRFERSPDKAVELTPVERDTYMQRMMVVRFRRDARGTVVGFDYGNPLVRDIRFTRLGARSSTAPASAVTADQERAPGAAPGAAPGVTPGATPDAIPSAAVPRLEGLAGEYELTPGRTLTITVEGQQLHGQPAGGAKLALAHVSGATFAAADRPITLTFTLGADGRATSLLMRQNGRERTLPRIP